MTAAKGSAVEVQSAASTPKTAVPLGSSQRHRTSKTTNPRNEIGRKPVLLKESMTSTTPSTLPNQCVRLVLEAEIFQDSDGGPDSLIYSTDTVACEPVSPARMLDMIAEARTKLDRIERLAREFEARDMLAAIIAEQNLHVEEWDLVNLDAKWRDTFVASAAATTDGQRMIVVPKGQDPIERLAAVADLLNDLDAQAARA